jgi:hypothetical protein
MTVVGILVSGALVVPASAHKRTITDVSSSVDEEDVIRLFAFMDPEQHAGTMKLTLKKKNAAGDWVVVRTKKAFYGGLGWGYFSSFGKTVGNRRCKPSAVFTSNNHPTLRKSGVAFDC